MADKLIGMLGKIKFNFKRKHELAQGAGHKRLDRPVHEFLAGGEHVPVHAGDLFSCSVVMRRTWNNREALSLVVQFFTAAWSAPTPPEPRADRH